MVLGGGLCVGTLTLLEEDRFSDHALCLARYFVAQGVSSGQRTLVLGAVSRRACVCMRELWGGVVDIGSEVRARLVWWLIC